MAERPEDLNLPNAVVTRIIKDAIPEGVSVSKEARLAISKAASVFVLYATSCSNNFALKNKRKTINAQDVLNAMEDMEFEQFIEPLQQCQEAFRQDKAEKRKERPPKPSPAISVAIEAEDEGEEGRGEKEEEDDSVVVQDDSDVDEAKKEGAESDADESGFVITVNQDDDDDVDVDDGESSPEVIEEDDGE